jgi:hypothetical protein
MAKFKIIFFLMIYFLSMLSVANAESIKQCFPLNNLPGRSTQSVWIQQAELKDESVQKNLSRKLSGSLFSNRLLILSPPQARIDSLSQIHK